MFFSVFVPGFGDIFVEARSASSAAVAVQQFLNRNRITLEEGSSIGSANPVAVDQVTGDLVLNEAGLPITVDRPEPDLAPPPAAGSPPASPAGSPSSAGSESPVPAPQQLFRFDVPVVGDLFVVASDAGEASTAGQRHLTQFVESAAIPPDFQLGTPEVLELGDLPMSADPNFLIDASGAIRDDLLSGVGVADDEEGPGPQSTKGNSTVVAKVTGANGSVEFFRVDAPDSVTGRTAIEAELGPSVTVNTITTADILLKNEPDFADAMQQSGLGDLDSFVQSLQLISSSAAAASNSEQESVSDTSMLADVQNFPFASFQNAVADLGLDPEGVLGSTVRQRFDALAPAAQIGSLTGTVTPIGQDPGALEEFFRDRFGDLDLAADTFSDLLAGRTSNDLSSDQLLAFQALQSPDVATSRGRSDATDVFRLARAAAADRFGPFVASRLLPSNARLLRELERRLAETDTDTDFLQFARQQNLLPV